MCPVLLYNFHLVTFPFYSSQTVAFSELRALIYSPETSLYKLFEYPSTNDKTRETSSIDTISSSFASTSFIFS